ncbi:MAG: hypothetical protein ACRERX_07000 [Pseudomonas sp.]
MLNIDDRTEGNGADELSRLLQDPHQNNRHDIWLWLCLYCHVKLDLDRNTCNGATMRDVIARALRRNTDLIALIPSEKDQYLVPDECFSWITKDERQYHWLLPEVDELTDKRFPLDLVHLTGRGHIIAMLDVWQVDIEKKAREIEHLHECWRRHTARDSQLEWFADKKEGTKRCVCAWEWLQKNHLRPFSRQLPISNYKELLMFFDQANLGENEQRAIIQQIKRRWSRKQFDERAIGKKQVNVMLAKTVIAQLDELAKRHDLKRAQVLETLVRMEADANVYLAEDQESTCRGSDLHTPSPGKTDPPHRA